MHLLVPLAQAAAGVGFLRFGVPHQVADPNRERDLEEEPEIESDFEESNDDIPDMVEPMPGGMYTNLVFIDIKRSRRTFNSGRY
jgi:hypothetical protein